MFVFCFFVAVSFFYPCHAALSPHAPTTGKTRGSTHHHHQSCATGCGNATGVWSSQQRFVATELDGSEAHASLELVLSLTVTAHCTSTGFMRLLDDSHRLVREVLLFGAWVNPDRFELNQVFIGQHRRPGGRISLVQASNGGGWEVTAIAGSERGEHFSFRTTITKISPTPLTPPSQLPNVLFLHVDDLGYADVNVPAFHGRTNVKTPNVARLAREGMTMTSYYAGANVCTPSRSALLSGRFPVKIGMENNNFRVLISTGQRAGLLPEYPVLSEVLQQQAQYRTGMTGKWHLGVGLGPKFPTLNNSVMDQSLMPWNRGFEDANYILPVGNGAGCSREASGTFPCSGSQLWVNGSIAEQPWRSENTTAILTRHALNFLGILCIVGMLTMVLCYLY